MKEITAIYHTNYNGWDIKVDGKYVDVDDDTMDQLVDSTDDVEKILRSHFGNDINITIEEDDFST